MTFTEIKFKMKRLIEQLNQATIAYNNGSPLMTDEEWDNKYFELVQLEKKYKIILPNSPSQHIIYDFEEVPALEKIEHNHLMLSLDKTKEIKEIENFTKDKKWIAMPKMDGLTCSLTYKNGKLFSAETRGNGIIGENILHNAKIIPSIPQNINWKDEITIDGEIICTYKNFKRYKDTYKNPRNFAAGSIRLLNSEECFNRKLTFVVWDIVKGSQFEYLSQNLTWINFLGFTTVFYLLNSDYYTIEQTIEDIKESSASSSYPIDGVVFKYDNIKEYNSMGRTDHHFKGGLAYKFYDELYDTKLQNIEWTLGRTGVLTPVAIFDPIDIDGSIVKRASLHNVSIMNELFHNNIPWVGQKIQVYKSNQIIPQVSSVKQEAIKDDVEYQFLPPPVICPYCGAPTKIKKDNDSEILWCSNSACSGQLINRLNHFCGKKGLDIKGLSKKTLEKLIDWGWIDSIKDIFTLEKYQKNWINQTGFGETSVNNILNAINKAKNCHSEKYLCAIGIPTIGKTASLALMKVFHNYHEYRKAINLTDSRLYEIAGIGEIMLNYMFNFNYDEFDFIMDNYIHEIEYQEKEEKENFAITGKHFCITGKLKHFKNRNEIKEKIESYGGKVTGSVSSKTNYLINNDKESNSNKNKEAKKLNIPIISEDDFLTMI